MNDSGPTIRRDIVDVYVFRQRDDADPDSIEILQLRRTESPLHGTWQPIMGHIEPGETASCAAMREVEEEVGIPSDAPAILGFWALEQVHPYYLHEKDQVVLSPRFALRVPLDWKPTLNSEHDDWRWVAWSDVNRDCMWPGQKAACAELHDEIANPRSLAAGRLRLNPSE